MNRIYINSRVKGKTLSINELTDIVVSTDIRFEGNLKLVEDKAIAVSLTKLANQNKELIFGARLNPHEDYRGWMLIVSGTWGSDEVIDKLVDTVFIYDRVEDASDLSLNQLIS